MTFAELARFMSSHPTMRLYASFQNAQWSLHIHDENDECLFAIIGGHIEPMIRILTDAITRAEAN